ncbi:DUF6101 family protein [Ochrobactrum soli]|uniref:Uncharacterized protein n=1 Tax=Ochrobactrum soli TaxID=2448455 RepID=A0A2P9HKF2_9HYPH|nr:DUF6101 family protein [[Ochrobactrum] soli]SPL64631.1 FIG00793409: hypothetical protein [[Ochrobactrum] soli]
MMSKGLKPDWAGRELRLDPFHFPQVVSYASHDGNTDVTFTINERGAVIQQVLPSSGLPMSIALPIHAFVGVVARAVEDEYGEITVTLELMHQDPQLSVPLLVAHDLTDVAADWRAWAAAFNLPMMLVEEDGVARPLYESTGPVRTSQPQARRQGHETRRRRPRFLARRKAGTLGVRLVIEGKEIIARN